MKRKILEKRLRQAGCYLKREGRSHSLWINPKTGVVEAIPRHPEIKEFLAKKILKPYPSQLWKSNNSVRCYEYNFTLYQSIGNLERVLRLYR